MRVLFLNPVGILGGAERVLLDLFAELPSVMPGLEMGLIACTAGPLAARAAALGVRVEVVPMPPAFAGLGSHAAGLGQVGPLLRSVGLAPGYLASLSRAVRRFRPEIVHSNGIKTHLLATVAVPLETPVLWHVHDFLSDRGGGFARVLGAASRRADLVVANSRAVAIDARRVLRSMPIEVVYNAVDTVLFAPGAGDGAKLDALAGVAPAAPGTVRVGLVATYARWKGHELFLEAAAAVAKQVPGPLRFYVVGGPVYLTPGSQYSVDELRKRAASLGVAEQVAFVPFQDDPADVFRALDVVVHASTRREPFGRTIVEAMACARAVVVSKAGGAAELFVDGEDALGFAPGGAGALAEVLAQLVTDAGLRGRLGACAREAALTRFARPRLGRETAAGYLRLLGIRPAPLRPLAW